MKQKSRLETVLLIVLLLNFFIAVNAFADLAGSSFTSYAPRPTPSSTFDLVFEVTAIGNDAEYIDRVDVTLPAGWIINSLTAPPKDSFCPLDTRVRSEGQKAIWEIEGGYSGGSNCGPWDPEPDPGTVYSFIVNVTVPDCSGSPWSIPWNIYGDRYMSNPPHDVNGTLRVDSCIVPSITKNHHYNFIIIDHPDAEEYTDAIAINDRGHVVGDYRAGSKRSGFLYDGVTFTDIKYPGATRTDPHGVNNNGWVVGCYRLGENSEDPWSGFILSPDGSYETIDGPGAINTCLYDINDNNTSVGWYHHPDWSVSSFKYTGSTLTEISYPGSSRTEAQCVNNKGHIVGMARDSTGEDHGFSYNGKHFSDFLYPKSTWFDVTGCNDSGIVVGWWDDSSFNTHGFLFDGLSTYRQIDFPDAVYTEVYDINNHGWFVGSYMDASGNWHSYLAKKSSWPLFMPAIIGGSKQK